MKMRVWLVMRVVAEWAELVVVGCWVWTGCGLGVGEKWCIEWVSRGRGGLKIGTSNSCARVVGCLIGRYLVAGDGIGSLQGKKGM